MINASEIKPDTPVVCSKNGKFATVDHMEGKDTIKLKKDEYGQHHYIPLSWVTRVDDEVHVDRSGTQAMREWTTEPPNLNKMTVKDFGSEANEAGRAPQQNRSENRPPVH